MRHASPCRDVVQRRELGYSCRSSEWRQRPQMRDSTVTAGRSGRRWRRLVAEVRARRAPCCRCGQPIDYTITYDPEAPDPACFSVDHFPLPLSTHPHLAEDPGNLAAAHLGCNVSAGNRTPKPGLGETSTDW